VNRGITSRKATTVSRSEAVTPSHLRFRTAHSLPETLEALHHAEPVAGFGDGSRDPSYKVDEPVPDSHRGLYRMIG
jgi:hypothetical protein